MKLCQEAEDSTNNRKFIKSQVEKRRRERMNCSLERLRTMLLQEPHQMGETQHRVEKAEILEHTVHFLQKTSKAVNQGAGNGGAGGGDAQKHSFQDGISTCLQRAVQFLGPEGKGLWLGAALDSSFAARFSRSDSDPAGVQMKTKVRPCSSSLPQAKSLLRLLRQKSTHRLKAQAFGANSSAHPYRLPAQQRSPRSPQQALVSRHQLETRVERKQSPAQSCLINQPLWRPWP